MITTLVGFFSLIVIVLAFIYTVYNWNINRNPLYMGLFLTLYALENLTYSIFVRGGSPEAYTLLYIIAPLYYAKAPFLYFYVRGITSDRFYFRKRDLLHFIPVLLQTLSNIPYLLMPHAEKVQTSVMVMSDYDSLKVMDISGFYPASWNTLVRAVLFFIYIIASLFLINRQYRSASGLKRVLAPFQQYVLKQLTVILSFVLGVASLSVVIGYVYVQYEQVVYTSDIIMRFLDVAMFLYFILPLLLLFNPRLLYGIPQSHDLLTASDSASTKANTVATADSTLTSKLKLEPSEKEGDNYLKTLSLIISEYIDREKPFLDKDFKIADISDALKIPSNHVQYCLNVLMKKSFHDLKMEKRIEAAKKMLLSRKNYSVDDIASKCGFGSVKYFHQHFRTATGLTPLKWQQLNSSKS